jgi:hypothetical protein
MENDMTDEYTIDKYDRLFSAMHDVSLFTKPSTVQIVQSLTGKTESFIVQTCRHDDNGDYIFIQRIDETGTVRIAVPPKVANLIASQRDSLTKRRRSISSKAGYESADGRGGGHRLPEEKSMTRSHPEHTHSQGENRKKTGKMSFPPFTPMNPLQMVSGQLVTLV